MSYRKYLLLNFFLFFFSFLSAGFATELRVSVSIAPLHSLVASVMKGGRPPDLVLRQNVSPHSYQLTPSKASLLARSDLVIWIGNDFERALGKIIATLPQGTTSYELGSAEAGCGVSPSHSDPHIWLDPVNAICMAQRIAARLARHDKENSALYRQNAVLLIKRLKELDIELKAKLAPLAGKRYLVFHDAYIWFETRYGLTSTGFFRKTPDRLPGARHIAKLRQNIRAKGVVCIFTEPGFTPAQVRAIVIETGLKTGILDPLGVDLQPGPELYFIMMRNLADNLRSCLKD